MTCAHSFVEQLRELWLNNACVGDATEQATGRHDTFVSEVLKAEPREVIRLDQYPLLHPAR